MSAIIEGFDLPPPCQASSPVKYGEWIGRFCTGYDSLRHMMAALLQPLPEHASILCLGPGAGAEILTLGSHHPSWRFAVVDPDPESLSHCRQILKAGGMDGSADLFNGYLQEYQAHALFDAVTSVFQSHSILDVDDKFAYFLALDARLKPGGMLVLADIFGDKGAYGFGRLAQAWLNQYLGQRLGSEEFESVRAYLETVDFVTEEELTALMLGAGFYEPIRFFQAFLFGGWFSRKFD